MDLEKIIAVIVLYNCSLEDSQTFQSLRDSISDYNSILSLVVYNNSPNYWKYEDVEYKGLDIYYVSDDSNSGVGKAYNTTFKQAKKLRKEYLILLDQDTQISKDYFAKFLNSITNTIVAKPDLFAPLISNGIKLLSPSKFILFSSRELSSIPTGNTTLNGLAIINSGLIISTALFEKVGGYNEKIKLDFSDFDFLKRCLPYTNNIFILNTTFHHSLSSEGEMTQNSALNRFDYYLEGAKYYNKSLSVAFGLYTWVFLRALKLNIKYKTLNFTSKTIRSIIKIP